MVCMRKCNTKKAEDRRMRPKNSDYTHGREGAKMSRIQASVLMVLHG